MSNNNAGVQTISSSVFSETVIVQIIIGITLALLLVEFWRTFLEALIFSKLGLNRNSAFQTFVVAIVLTIIVILIINYFRAPANDIILGIDPDRNDISKTQNFLGGGGSTTASTNNNSIDQTDCDCEGRCDCDCRGDCRGDCKGECKNKCNLNRKRKRRHGSRAGGRS